MHPSEAQLRIMMDTIPALAWCNLPDGSNEFLNKRWHDYTGLSPEEVEGRITGPYERSLTTLVDNIQHTESTSLNGQAIVKIYLQPGASLDTANAAASRGPV